MDVRSFYKCMLMSSLVVLTTGIIFSWITFPDVVKRMIGNKVNLKLNSQMREVWSKQSHPMLFRIYAFNITNPEEYINGGSVKIQQVGPYNFDLWKEKINQKDNENEDTTTFDIYEKYIFRADKSNGLSGNEEIIMPHLLLQSIGIMIKRNSASMLQIIGEELNKIFPGSSPLLKGKVLDIFFNGITIDCASSINYNESLICMAFHANEVRGVRRINETHFKFSIFGNVNHTISAKMSVNRGIKNISKLGKIEYFNGVSILDNWNGSDCNKLIGSDLTIFPPFSKSDQNLLAFIPELCSPLSAKYEKHSKICGVPIARYTFDFENLKNNTKYQCYCKNSPNGWENKGIMDLESCLGAPILASMPHFYNGDENLSKHIYGLMPIKSKHEMFFDFISISGTPVAATKRLQFNLDTEPISFISGMKNLSKYPVPMFWIEEIFKSNDEKIRFIKRTIHWTIFIQSVAQWISIFAGAAGVYLCTILYYKSSAQSQQEEEEESSDSCSINFNNDNILERVD